jgi:hypothetical protein
MECGQKRFRGCGGEEIRPTPAGRGKSGAELYVVASETGGQKLGTTAVQFGTCPSCGGVFIYIIYI